MSLDLCTVILVTHQRDNVIFGPLIGTSIRPFEKAPPDVLLSLSRENDDWRAFLFAFFDSNLLGHSKQRRLSRKKGDLKKARGKTRVHNLLSEEKRLKQNTNNAPGLAGQH